MAERMLRIESLRAAKIVPDVSENCQLQPLQRHILRRGRLYRSTDPHLGQKASPPLSANRMALKRSYASSSERRSTWARLSVRAFELRRKCCATGVVSNLQESYT